MTPVSANVRDRVSSRLRESGIATSLSPALTQFLQLDGEVFVEIVLNDGAELERADDVMSELKQELVNDGVTLDVVVRALWQVYEIHDAGASPAPSGGIRASERYSAMLKSGARTCNVVVDVTLTAAQILNERFALRDAPRELRTDMLARMVRRFLEHQLSLGGTSYWNPLLDQNLEIDGATMSFLLGQSAVFEELRQAIQDALEPPMIDVFIRDLSQSGVELRDFEHVLPSMSGMLGGAYKPGDTFSTSTVQLFRELPVSERELLKKYFLTKITEVIRDARFADLRESYPNVFAR